MILMPPSDAFVDSNMENLFRDLLEEFKSTGNNIVLASSDELDAVEQNMLDNGSWGIVYDENSLGIWVMTETGTFICYPDGSTDTVDFDTDDLDIPSEVKKDIYLKTWWVLAQFIDPEIMPERLPVDNLQDEAELLEGLEVEDDEELN